MSHEFHTHKIWNVETYRGYVNMFFEPKKEFKVYSEKIYFSSPLQLGISPRPFMKQDMFLKC